METIKKILGNDEKAVFALRALYNSYGYSQYRMSKFEEYDLYAKNKDFLVSENVITFTDTDGKLLALKPDVTLSIIKNNKDAGQEVKKVYYDEHVYRVSKGTHSYKEIMQAGLECLGNIDEYSITEVILLAIKSIELISDESVLDLSHLGIVSGVIDSAGVSATGKSKIFACLSDKNLEGVKAVLKAENVSEDCRVAIEKLVTVYGSPKKVMPIIDDFAVNDTVAGCIKEFKTVVETLTELGLNDKINVDFSVVNDTNYYNGFTFKGFVSGIPTSILSGGQYDTLMKKMGRRDRAIGFAVYLDELEKMAKTSGENDFDVAIEYGECPTAQVVKVVNELTKEGKTVIAKKKIVGGIKYGKLVKLD